MSRLTRRIASALTPLALAAGIAAVATGAGAQELLVGGYAGSMLPSGSLMAPIAPSGFVGDAAATQAALPLPVASGGNSAFSSTSGNGSLSLIHQSGSGNRAAQIIEGSNTALGLVQSGSGNSVIQASFGDDNRQIVGVSGSNNDVAYVQVGNQLAGALSVTNASNVSVLALQTPQSGHYLAPTAIRGLSNAVVIVGPGRMHVINKNSLR